MPATMQVESTLTDRYQTTVPDTVRRALRLGKRDKISYTIRPDGLHWRRFSASWPATWPRTLSGSRVWMPVWLSASRRWSAMSRSI